MGSVTTDDVQADTYSDKAGTGAPDFPQGLTSGSIVAATLDKQYLGGTDFTIGTTGVTGVTFNRSILIPYETSDGAWRMKGNISLEHDADTSFNVTITDIVFKNVTGYNQAVTTREADGRAFCNPNGNTISVAYGSGPTATNLTLDIELDSKPTWAD